MHFESWVTSASMKRWPTKVRVAEPAQLWIDQEGCVAPQAGQIEVSFAKPTPH